MTTNTTDDCKNFEALLLEGDAPAMQTAAAHARECASCAATLAEWNELSATARTLHETWESDLLWPRIERKLREERSQRSSRLWQIAASVALTVTLAGGAWMALDQRADRRAFERSLLRANALSDAEKAERDHIAAIERLEDVAEAKLDEAETPLMVSYKEKLMLLNDAIDECQTQIEQNRRNAHLRRQLLAMYSEKQRTLEDVLQEETNDVQQP